MNVFEKIRECEYMPDMDFPARTDPDFDAKRAEFDAATEIGAEAFKADLLAEHGLTGNAKAIQAFEIAYQREGYLGFDAVLSLFEDLIPIIVETH